MKKPVSVRLKQVSLESVDKLAAEKGWTRTDTLERLIDEALVYRERLIGRKVQDTWRAGDEHFRHVRPTIGSYDDEA